MTRILNGYFAAQSGRFLYAEEVRTTTTEITFTVSQLLAWFLAVCAGVTCIATAASWINKAWHAARAPDDQQDARIKALEVKTQSYDGYFANDKKRLDTLEEGTRVTQRALLALLAHGIDGNEVAGLKAAKDELQQYLIER
jgi:hypothetical protein